PDRGTRVAGGDSVVEEGELVAVMGPSGSGKSTLLAIAGTLEEPTSGEVWLAGAAVAGLSVDERATLRRRHVGYVFQQYNLLPGLTAVENVALPLELDGVGRRAAPSGWSCAARTRTGGTARRCCGCATVAIPP